MSSDPIVVVYSGGKYGEPRVTEHVLPAFHAFVRVEMARKAMKHGDAAKAAGISHGRWSQIVRSDQLSTGEAEHVARGLGYSDLASFVSACEGSDR